MFGIPISFIKTSEEPCSFAQLRAAITTAEAHTPPPQCHVFVLSYLRERGYTVDPPIDWESNGIKQLLCSLSKPAVLIVIDEGMPEQLHTMLGTCFDWIEVPLLFNGWAFLTFFNCSSFSNGVWEASPARGVHS